MSGNLEHLLLEQMQRIEAEQADARKRDLDIIARLARIEASLESQASPHTQHQQSGGEQGTHTDDLDKPLQKKVAGAAGKLPGLTEVRDVIIPAASRLIPTIPFTPESNVMLLAIGLQESRFKHRKQVKGPARGFWQFESGGGTKGVLTHKVTRKAARSLAQQHVGTTTDQAVNEALAEDDVLACAFARLLLWTDTAPLPSVGKSKQAWEYYIRNWRPGKPHRATWNGLYEQACQMMPG